MLSHDFSKPVTAQILPQNVLPIFKNTNVIAPGMYKVPDVGLVYDSLPVWGSNIWCNIHLYFISLQDSTTPNPICLMAKATSSQAWLWHRRLSHLNFDTINLLSKNNIVNGLPKLKFVKDHLCSSCELGKAKKKMVKIRSDLTPFHNVDKVLEQDSLKSDPQSQENVYQTAEIETTSNELELILVRCSVNYSMDFCLVVSSLVLYILLLNPI
ncbi:retrovirus-related pol polyprotein from transposon TNT 1-94 [Tanacetum coccineum]